MQSVTTVPSTDRTDTAPRTYMWVVTVQWPVGSGGFGNATFSGTTDLPADMSRTDAFTQILALAKDKTGAESLNVLFFALEPDALTR